MKNLDKIGKDNAKLMLQTFSFLGEEKLEFIKKTKMFKFLNNDYETTYNKYKTINGIYTKTDEKAVYKSKVRVNKDKDYLDHSKIIIPLELDTLLVCNVINEEEHQKLTNMSKSNDLEMIKLAETIVFEKRQQKLKSKIYKCLKTTKKEI